MIAILGFLQSGLGQIVVMGLGALALWGAFKLHYESKGASRAVAKIERANNAAASNARTAAAGVTDPRVRGVLDPNSVDE